MKNNTNYFQTSLGGAGGVSWGSGGVWEPSWAWKTRRFDDMAYFPFDRIQVQASFEKGQARPGSSRAQKMPKKPRIIDVSTPKMAVFWPKMDDSLTQVGPWMARGTPRQVRGVPKNAIPKPNWLSRGPGIWQRTHKWVPPAYGIKRMSYVILPPPWSKKCIETV